MQVRTRLATRKTTIWTGPSHHSFIGWDQATSLEQKLYSMSYFNFFHVIHRRYFSIIFHSEAYSDAFQVQKYIHTEAERDRKGLRMIQFFASSNLLRCSMIIFMSIYT
jgi:hypothetical protein